MQVESSRSSLQSSEAAARTDGYRQSSVHIIPRAFGSTKARMRISNHVLQPWNFQHQFYENVGAAKRALTMKLEETFPQ